MELEKQIVGLVTDHAVLKQKIRRGNRTKRHIKENCTSIRDRFMKGPASRASQLKMNWTEETCFEIYEEQVAVRES